MPHKNTPFSTSLNQQHCRGRRANESCASKRLSSLTFLQYLAGIKQNGSVAEMELFFLFHHCLTFLAELPYCIRNVNDATALLHLLHSYIYDRKCSSAPRAIAEMSLLNMLTQETKFENHCTSGMQLRVKVWRKVLCGKAAAME